MADKKINDKVENTSFDGPVDTGNPHKNRPADRKDSGQKKIPKIKMPPISELFGEVEGLSEDFVEKASVLFESAVSERVYEIRESLEAELQERMETAYEDLAEDLGVQLEAYLDKVAEDYFEENQLEIEDEFRSEIAEGLLSSFYQLAEAASFSIPESDADLVQKLSEDNKILQNKLNKILSENIELTDEINQYSIQTAFDKATHDLSEATKDKLFKLTENMQFSSVDDFNSKFKIIKESITEKKQNKSENRNLTEEYSRKETPVSMSGALRALNGYGRI